MFRTVLFMSVLSAGVVIQAQTAAPAPKSPPPAAAPSKPRPAARPAAAAKPASPKPGAAKRAAAAPTSKAAPAALATDDQKTIYALGLALERSIHALELSHEELAIVARALSDGASGKPALDLDEWGPRIDPLANVRRQHAAERRKAASAAYLDTAAAEAGAVRTASGLVYREIVAGAGQSPKASDTVKVHYRGTLRDGRVFDSSYERNEPASFQLSQVIPCWTEGVQRMKVGGKARLVCPSSLAYGDDDTPDIPGGSALIFEVDLLEIAGASAP
jgi:FKBP-type peptidyl-prolyl cis-trans isomerase FkpA